MTVCIAAACEVGWDDDSPSIVICSDMQASAPSGASMQTLFKNRFLAGGWLLSYAGLLTEEIASSRHIQSVFAEMREQTIDETNIRELLGRAWQRRKRERADTISVEHLALTYGDLLSLGPEKLALEPFAGVLREINGWRPEEQAHYIVTGIKSGLPFLLETPPDGGVPVMLDDYAVIGSGQHLAHASLMRRKQSPVRSLAHTIYTVFEAKKAAEADPFVGDRTVMCVQKQDETAPLYISSETLERTLVEAVAELSQLDELPAISMLENVFVGSDPTGA